VNLGDINMDFNTALKLQKALTEIENNVKMLEKRLTNLKNIQDLK